MTLGYQRARRGRYKYSNVVTNMAFILLITSILSSQLFLLLF